MDEQVKITEFLDRMQ